MRRTLRPLVAATAFLVPAIALTGLAATSSTSKETTVDAGPVFGPTVKLFNGKDLQGWTAFFNNGSTNPADAFFVEGGILKCKGQPIGYIETKKKYESFELHVEWRFVPEKGAGNSGVLLRVVGPDKVWPKSIEAQLHSRNAGDIWNIGEYAMKADAERTRGRRTIKANETNEKPLGEWNAYRILLDGGNLTLEVNGLVQNTATDCEVVPGRIGFQSEGAWIEFRKIELRPIIGSVKAPAGE
ncbi:MAG: DUF1080 domain-containing protein [Phycisphaerales bacterium]|nr:DUF1080 domain-containing protein [Phycisphaerales bacterium]